MSKKLNSLSRPHVFGGASKTDIRLEQPKDFGEIEKIVIAAFGKEGQDVARLVREIRSSDNYVPELSLVAEKDNETVGFTMLSYLEIVNDANNWRVLTLSPLAVAPNAQKQGIGGQLVKAACDLTDKRGEPLIVLEGSPNYYPRFGFKYSVPLGITIDLPSWAPKEAAMILPLTCYNSDIKGKVIHPSYFDPV